MAELADLYQEIILEHSRRPRNQGTLTPFDREARGYNPVCGDEVVVYVAVDDAVITDIRFVGQGCALSRASASLMTEHVKGLNVAAAQAAVRRMLDAIQGSGQPDAGDAGGELAALTAVKKFPARIRCVTLCWQALADALAAGSSSRG